MVSSAQIYIPPVQVQSSIGSSSDPKSIVNFFDVMKNSMMMEYADPDGTISYRGVEVSGEDKYGVLGTLVFNQMLNDTSYIIESVINAEQIMVDLSKEAGRMLGG